MATHKDKLEEFQLSYRHSMAGKNSCMSGTNCTNNIRLHIGKFIPGTGGGGGTPGGRGGGGTSESEGRGGGGGTGGRDTPGESRGWGISECTGGRGIPGDSGVEGIQHGWGGRIGCSALDEGRESESNTVCETGEEGAVSSLPKLDFGLVVIPLSQNLPSLSSS